MPVSVRATVIVTAATDEDADEVLQAIAALGDSSRNLFVAVVELSRRLV